MAVQACVAGMFEYKDFGAFKQHLRDFLVQVRSIQSPVCTFVPHAELVNTCTHDWSVSNRCAATQL